MKESLRHIDKTVIFRETFNSASDVIDNGGTITDVTFDNGVGNFTNGKIIYKNKKVNTANGISYVINLGENFSNIASGDTLFSHIKDANTNIFVTFGVSNFSVYLQSSSGNFRYYTFLRSFWNNFKQMVLTIDSTLTLKAYRAGLVVTEQSTSDTGSPVNFKVNDFQLGATVGGTADLSVNIDLVDIYNRALTAEEVSALYKDQLYSKPSLSNATLNIPVNGSIYDTEGNVITNTDVDVVRDGSKDVMKFNGSTSYLSCGTTEYLQADDDFTIGVWVKPYDVGSWNAILGDNSQSRYSIYSTHTNEQPMFYHQLSDSSLFAFQNVGDVMIPNKWCFLLYTKEGTVLKLYQNGKYKAQTDMLLQGITPLDTLIIGKAGARMGNHSLKEMIILSVPLTAEEVAREYNSTKAKYGL